MTVEHLFKSYLSIGVFVFALTASAQEPQGDRIDEISIFGTSEKPKVSFDLTWKLPSIQKRSEQELPKDLSGMMVPLSPEQHRKQTYFLKYLQIESTNRGVQ